MATRTIGGFTAGLTGNLTEAAQFAMADSAGATRRYTIPQVRARLLQNIDSDLKFADATYDIGKSGATRPRDGFFSRNMTLGGLLDVTGATTLRSTVQVLSIASLAGAVLPVTDELMTINSGVTNKGRFRQKVFSIAAGGTADIDIRGGLTESFLGILMVHKARTANVTFSTRTLYFVHGRGTSMTFTSLGTGNGTGGASGFSIANSGTGGIARITDTVTENSEIHLLWIGTDAS